MDHLVDIMGQEWVDKSKAGIAAQAHINMLQSLAKQLSEACEWNKITEPEELGKRAGYSPRSIRNYMYLGDDSQIYKKHRIPPVTALLSLALALGVDLEDLVPRELDLRQHIEKSKHPDTYLSVEAFVRNQLTQFFQNRDRMVKGHRSDTERIELKKVDDFLFNRMVAHVMELYAELETIPDCEKCKVLSTAIDRFYYKGLLQEYQLDFLLDSVLYKYFTHNRPEEQQGHWRYVAETAMEEIRSKRQEEYQEVEVSIDELLGVLSAAEDGPPLKWPEVFGVIEDEQEQRQHMPDGSGI